MLQGCDVRAEIAAIELDVSCPNVETGLDIGADPLHRSRSCARQAGHEQAADRQAHAQHRRRRSLRARRPGRRRDLSR